MWSKLTEHLVVDPTEVVGIQDIMNVVPEGEASVKSTTITLRSGAVIVTSALTASEILDKISITWVEKRAGA